MTEAKQDGFAPLCPDFVIVLRSQQDRLAVLQEKMQEYIENGVHMNRQSRQGIFQASDSNRDGYVSESEYVLNRIITDEAKEIFYKMDTDRDSRLTEKEDRH